MACRCLQLHELQQSIMPMHRLDVAKYWPFSLSFWWPWKSQRECQELYFFDTRGSLLNEHDIETRSLYSDIFYQLTHFFNRAWSLLSNKSNYFTVTLFFLICYWHYRIPPSHCSSPFWILKHSKLWVNFRIFLHKLIIFKLSLIF